MSEQQELATGRELDPEIKKQYGIYSSRHLQAYVTQVGNKIADVSDRSDIVYHFTVLDSPVVNAFALPGGYIYITRGLLAHINSEAELAGILAHEIGHVTARHAVRQHSKAASYQIAAGIVSIFVPEAKSLNQFTDVVFAAITSGYSREYETEADSLSVAYVIKAGYNPRAMASVLRMLELLDRYAPGKKTYARLFATHPEIEKRICDIEQQLSAGTLSGAFSSVTGKQNYLKQIDGLVFGNDPREGLISGNRFQHPGFQIEVCFPKEWQINNLPYVVIAEEPSREYHIELKHHLAAKKQHVVAMTKELSMKLGLKEITGSKQSINGLEAYVGTYAASLRSGRHIMVRAGFFLQGNNFYSLSGISEPEDFRNIQPFFDETINSFKELTPEEAESIRPDRVHVYRVKHEQSLDSILRELGRGRDEIKTVALINSWDPEHLPALNPGMNIKVLSNLAEE